MDAGMDAKCNISLLKRSQKGLFFFPEYMQTFHLRNEHVADYSFVMLGAIPKCDRAGRITEECSD